MDINQNYDSSSIKRNGKQTPFLQSVYPGGQEKSTEEQVAKEISKLFAAARRRFGVVITVAIACTIVFVYFLSKRPPTYQGKFQLLVEPVTIAENKLLTVITKTLGETNSKTDSGLDYDSQINVLISPKLMSPIIAQIQTKYPEVDYKAIIGKLKIERLMKESEGTRILEVTYSDQNANKVQFILNQVAQGYLRYSVEDYQTNIRQGIKFIEDQIPSLQRRVDTIQGQLQLLRQKYKLSDPNIESKFLSDQALNIGNQKMDVLSRLAQKNAEYGSLKKLFDEGKITAILSQDNTAYGILIKQMYELDNEVLVTSNDYQESSELMQGIRLRQRALQIRARAEAISILEKLKAEIQGLEARQQIITQAEKSLNQRITQFPAVARQYADLQRELEVSTDTLNQLVSKRDALRIDVAQQGLPWQLIAPPEIPRDKAGKPIKAATNKKSYILLAITGLVFGLGAGFLVEVLNNVFHSPEDVQDETKLPLLGVIPFTKELRKRSLILEIATQKFARVTEVANLTQRAIGNLMVASYKTTVQGYTASPFLEAFRYFYTYIRLLSSDKPIHSLVISSATLGDGKSTIAINLAKTAAAIGQRVLLVDADLRRPKIHQKLDLPNLRGLSEIISADIGLNEVIQRSHLEENLFVLTAGSTPPDPIKHLSSEKMRHLMEQFQAFFDLVIYDTPPLFGLADGNLLAAYTDGVVLVVGLEKTDRFMVLKALDGLNIAGSTVLGVVANGVKGFKSKSYKVYQKI